MKRTAIFCLIFTCILSGCNDEKEYVKTHGMGVGYVAGPFFHYGQTKLAETRHFNLGNILLNIGNNHEAAAYYIQTLRLAPSLKEAYNNLGTILVADGKFDEAIILFQKAISLNTNFLEAKHN